jgi:hypothetical protein
LPQCPLWSKGMCAAKRHVCFSPESGHLQRMSAKGQ